MSETCSGRELEPGNGMNPTLRKVVLGTMKELDGWGHPPLTLALLPHTPSPLYPPRASLAGVDFYLHCVPTTTTLGVDSARLERGSGHLCG